MSTVAQRQKRSRSKIHATAVLPRLSVHRTNKGLYAQLIDDVAGKTLVAVSQKESEKGTKTEKAKALGTLIAKKALAAKVSQAIFDRGSYRYHGRVKAFAEGAREGGLKF